MLNLTQKQLIVLNYFLEELEVRYSSDSCNDLHETIAELFTKKEQQIICKEYSEFNDTPNEKFEWPLSNEILLFWLKEKINIEFDKNE